jgi:hypothetical protein
MSPHRAVNVSKLAPGDTLVQPVFSEGLTKLLGAGCAVSEQLISRLAERGVTEVVVQIPAAKSEKHQRRAVPPTNVRQDSVIDTSRVVEHSCQCGSVIAIQAPTADLPAAAWVCKECGAVYFGGADSVKNRGVDPLAGDDLGQVASDDQLSAQGASTAIAVRGTPPLGADEPPAGVDQNVEAAQTFKSCVDNLIDPLACTDIGLDESVGRAASGDGPRCGEHCCASAGKAIYHGFTDALGSAGDEDSFTVEFTHPRCWMFSLHHCLLNYPMRSLRRRAHGQGHSASPHFI